MASKRMFSKQAVRTDRYLDMPLTAQAVYFHLNMEADDDGFIGSKKRILSMIGASQEDYNCLVENGYILEFESGIIVITHWNIHNTIQKDRYKPTIYQDELSTLLKDCNKVYTKRFQNGSNMETQYSVDKNRLDIDKNSVSVESCGTHTHGTFNNVFLTDKEYQQLKTDYPNIADDIINQLSENIKAGKENGITGHIGRLYTYARNYNPNYKPKNEPGHKPSYDIDLAINKSKNIDPKKTKRESPPNKYISEQESFSKD